MVHPTLTWYDYKMNPAMYIFANDGLKMSQGKLAAQVGHAAVDAFVESDPDTINEWSLGGHKTKLVMHADNEAHLLTIERYLNDRGFTTALVIDEGRTEISSHTATALGVEIVDKDDPHVSATFSTFRTLKPVDDQSRQRLKQVDPNDPPAVMNYFETSAQPKMEVKSVKEQLIDQVLKGDNIETMLEIRKAANWLRDRT